MVFANFSKMIKIAKTIITAIIILGSNSVSFAQTSASASAEANIIIPIAITKVTDMNFGNVAVSASTGGTVILGTSSIRTTGGAGGITLPATTGTVKAAEFTVIGQASYSYVITLPASCTISDGSGHTMTVNSFTSSPASTGTLSGSGRQSLKVSATMVVPASQPAGVYTNPGGVAVTINYN